MVLAIACAAYACRGAYAGAASTPAPTPTTSPAADYLTILSIEGKIQVRSAVDEKWQSAKVGMLLREGAELRVGIRSNIQLQGADKRLFLTKYLGIYPVTRKD